MKIHIEQENPKDQTVSKFTPSQVSCVMYPAQWNSDQGLFKAVLKPECHKAYCTGNGKIRYRYMGWISTPFNWWLSFACWKPAINLQKVIEVHSKIFFVQPNQMLTVLQKGEADTNVFHDSSSQPEKWEDYGCLISVTAQESAPPAIRREGQQKSLI